MKAVALLISLVANAMSVYYSYSWFDQALPVVGAASMSIIMVACISLAPQFIIILSRKRTVGTIVASIIIGIVAVPSAVFSMGATVGGLYNQRSRTIQENESETRRNDITAMRINAFEARIVKIKKDLETAAKEEALYWERYTALSNSALGSRTESMLLDRVENARLRIEELNTDLDSVTQDLAIANTSAGESNQRDDFYTWLSSRFGVSVDSMEFLLASFPAVFIDVIAPTMLAVSLFL